jgi:hypothetical protein
MNKKLIDWWGVSTSDLIISENFDRVSADISGALPVPTGISNWVKLYGNTGIISTTPGQGKNTSSSAVYSTGAGVRNVDISIVCSVITSNLYIQFAEADINNRFIARLNSGQIDQRLGGVSTIPFVGSGSTSNGDTMRFVLNGTSLKIYRNTTLLNDAVVSASVNGTNVGILFFPLDTTARVDDFIVRRV